MFATKSINRPAAAMSLALVLGAVALNVSPAQAVELPKFNVHVTAPRVTEASIEKIVPGMSEADVESLEGQPEHATRFPLSNTTAWDYDYRAYYGDSTFSVIFDGGGHVVSKISLRNDEG